MFPTCVCENLFCKKGSEEETGGYGAKDVSTVVDGENLVRRRRSVVTRRLVALAEGPQPCLSASD